MSDAPGGWPPVRPARVLPPPTPPGGNYPIPPQSSSWQGYPPAPYPDPYARLGASGPPGWYPAPPARRSRSFARTLLGLVGSLATVLFALILLGAALQGTGVTTGESRAIDHSPAEPSRDAGRPRPGNPAAVLTDNPLYSQGGLANGRCSADVEDASSAAQKQFYESLLGCLNAEWSGPVRAAGFRYSAPGLVVFDSPVTTPCGSANPESGNRLAFYCPGDSVMYADVPQMRRFFSTVDVAYGILIGHEFGHHVQFETGILGAYDNVTTPSEDERLELSRRVELQASCLGGLFLGAVAETFPVTGARVEQLEQVAGSLGDSPSAPGNTRDHGTGTSNRSWIMGAFADNDIEFCNTFTVRDSAVE